MVMATSGYDSRNFEKHFADDLTVTAKIALDEVVTWVRENLAPEQVFADDVLEEWAMGEGFVRKGEG